MNIVLYQPEIPGNTGNIARLCAATGCKLHLIRPLGFSVEDKYLKRAGLDYWNLVEITYYDSWDEFKQIHNQGKFYFNTTKGHRHHASVKFNQGDFLVFGKETAGLPPEILVAHPEDCLRIPMISEARSLNLSNSVAIVVYEALRQLDFPNLTY